MQPLAHKHTMFDGLFKRPEPTHALHNSDELAYVQLRSSLNALHAAMDGAGFGATDPHLMFPVHSKATSMEFFVHKLSLIAHAVLGSPVGHAKRKILPHLTESLVYLVFCAKTSNHSQFRQDAISLIKLLN